MFEENLRLSADASHSHESVTDANRLEDINIGQYQLARLQNLGWMTDPEAIGSSGPELNTEAGRRQIESKLALVTDILHQAQAEEVPQPETDSPLDRRIGTRALEIALDRATESLKSDDRDQAQNYLVSGLMIDHACFFRGQFIDQAIVAGLTNELIDAVLANRNLVFVKDIAMSMATSIDVQPETPISMMARKKGLLEATSGFRLEINDLTISLKEPLTDDQIKAQILTKGNQSDLATAIMSPSIRENRPNLQTKLIRALLDDFASGLLAVDDIADLLVGLSQTRPDLFSDDSLAPEFDRIRQFRDVADDYRASKHYILDAAIAQLWIDGQTDLAAKMLTTTTHEKRLMAWAIDSQCLDDESQALMMRDQITDYIDRKMIDINNQVNRYIDEFDDDATNQPEATIWLRQILSEKNIDQSGDPERYLLAVKAAVAKLLERHQLNHLDRYLEAVNQSKGSNKIDWLNLASESGLADLMDDQVVGPYIDHRIVGLYFQFQHKNNISLNRNEDQHRAQAIEDIEEVVQFLLEQPIKAMFADQELAPILSQLLFQLDSEDLIPVIESIAKNSILKAMLIDEYTGEYSKNKLIDQPQIFTIAAEIIGDPEFSNLIQDCQIDPSMPFYQEVSRSFYISVRPEHLNQDDSDYSPASVAIKNISRTFRRNPGLIDAINQLTDDQREAFFLKFFQLIIRPATLDYDTLEIGQKYESLLTNSSVTELLNMPDQNNLMTQSQSLDYILALDPDSAAEVAGDLLEALKLVDQPAIMENPSLRCHVSDALLNAQPGEHRQVAGRLNAIIGHPRELWKSLYLFSTEVAGIDPGGDHYNNIHPITTFPKLHLKLADYKPQRTIDAVAGFDLFDLAELSVKNRKDLLDDPEGLTDEEVAQITEIPFNRLKPDYRRQVYAHRLYETIRQTRSVEAKTAANWRNRQLVETQPEILADGDLIHNTNPDALGSILQDGNMAGESRHLSSATDAFPFNVDLSVIREIGPTPADTIGRTISAGYGSMTLVYGKNTGGRVHEQSSIIDNRPGHALALGGVAATEISAIILKQPSQLEVIKAKQTVAENGFYIPLYDQSGNLLLTAAEYDDQRDSYNLDRVEVDWVEDNSMSVENQIGSNNGSEYYISDDDGSQKRFYVKFGGVRNRESRDVSATDHVWTEFLADQIYRQFGATVPDTKMVRIEGRLGRASLWLDADSVPEAEIQTKAGAFVADAWLGNWDVVYNDANIVRLNQAAWRIDNGNALDIRSQGGRKAPEAWTAIVGELENGQDRERLAKGMRQEYPNLTATDFASQVDRLIERFPDDVIDSMVDSIRRSRDDRASLKQILKARRDYIADQRNRIVDELNSRTNNDQRLALAA